MGREDSLVIGIDEAGRGPVIGPMVIAAAVCNKNQLPSLEGLDLKDSKLVARSKRDELDSIIKDQLHEFHIFDVTPAEIDNHNINMIEIKHMAKIINRIKPNRVIFDLPVNPAAKSTFMSLLRSLLEDVSTTLIGENKADQNYPIVCAASILAKVRRDSEIRKLHSQYGDFGWGYPSEEKTQVFLEKWWKSKGDFPHFVRKRWMTAKRIRNNYQNIKLNLDD